METEDANSINVPVCDDKGAFEEIQCDKHSGRCWCVDKLGFERAGTRARSLEFVNCTRKLFYIKEGKTSRGISEDR